MRLAGWLLGDVMMYMKEGHVAFATARDGQRGNFCVAWDRTGNVTATHLNAGNCLRDGRVRRPRMPTSHRQLSW